jgi:hypothetical protein
MATGSGSQLLQVYFNDVNTFISQDNFSAPYEDIFGGASFSYARATLFNAPDGNLYFALAYTQCSVDQPTEYARLRIYKSPLGDGSDWEMHSEIKSLRWQGYSSSLDNSARYLPISHPYFIGNRWILAHVNFMGTGYVSGLRANLSISTSDDNGLTWTERATYSDGFGDDLCSRNFGYIDGVLWWSWSDENDAVYFVKSTDGGLTWSGAFSIPYSNDTCGNVVMSDNDKLYIIQHRYSEVGERVSMLMSSETSPSSYTDFITEDTFLPIATAFLHRNFNKNYAIAVKCGDKLVISGEDYVVGTDNELVAKRVNL